MAIVMSAPVLVRSCVGTITNGPKAYDGAKYLLLQITEPELFV
jgi:hypothetical protein